MRSDKQGFEHYFSARQKSKPKLGLVRTSFKGISFEFLTLSGTFSRKHIDLGTRLLIENMILPKKGLALDIGCGYGAVGIAAAVFNPSLHVIMTDINVRAVRLARKNVEMNGVHNAEVRRGSLYEPVEDLGLDCILSNPPVSSGMKTVEAIIAEAPCHMRPNASLQMVVRSKIAGKRLQSFFENTFGSFEILARESGYRILASTKL